MAKYLIIFLIFAIVILLIIRLSPALVNLNQPQPTPAPLPILTAPSSSPINNLQTQQPQNTPPPTDLMQIQAEADQDFADKIKEINDLYPWLDKLPIQTQQYFVYFNVKEKTFIAKLYPSSSSTIPADQQIESLKNEITAKLQTLIPNYNQYNIRWDITPE